MFRYIHVLHMTCLASSEEWTFTWLLSIANLFSAENDTCMCKGYPFSSFCKKGTDMDIHYDSYWYQKDLYLFPDHSLDSRSTILYIKIMWKQQTMGYMLNIKACIMHNSGEIYIIKWNIKVKQVLLTLTASGRVELHPGFLHIKGVSMLAALAPSEIIRY